MEENRICSTKLYCMLSDEETEHFLLKNKNERIYIYMEKWDREEVIVQFHECEQYSHVHNSVYFIWFEKARFRIAEELKLLSYVANMEKDDGDMILFPVLETECEFLSPIPFDTHLIVSTKLLKPKMAKFVFQHIITGKDDGKTYTEAKTTVGVLSVKHGFCLKMDPVMEQLVSTYFNDD